MRLVAVRRVTRQSIENFLFLRERLWNIGCFLFSQKHNVHARTAVLPVGKAMMAQKICYIGDLYQVSRFKIMYVVKVLSCYTL
jgi:hypothetical protein